MYNQTAVLPISKERAAYLHKQKRKKYMIRTIQISVVIILLAMWEILANIGVIDSFIMSQPSRMVKTLLNLGENGLLTHLGVTCMETLIGFLLGTVLGVGLAVLLWWSKTLSRICEPFLVVLNALPKIALGPVFIVWVGAWNAGHHCDGAGNFVDCYGAGNAEWFFEHRRGNGYNGPAHLARTGGRYLPR